MKPILLCLLFCACDETVTATNDLAVVQDLTARVDSFVLTNCRDTEACIQKCTAANANTCVPACIDKLDPAAQTYFNALQACAGPACYQVDGGAGPCADPSAAVCATCVLQKCGSEQSACLAH
jgi:hypothetical protein